MKILIVRFSSIGDIVLTTPVVRCIAARDKTEVHYLTKPAFASMLTSHPGIEKVHILEDDWGRMIEKLRAERFDTIIDLHHNLRTLRLKKALGVRAYSFHKINFQKWLMVNLKLNRLPDVHIVDRYLDTAGVLGIKNDQEGLDYMLTDADISFFNQWSQQQDIGPYVAISVAAAHATKCLTPDQIAHIASGLNSEVVLLGGPGEKALAERICKLTNRSVFNAVGHFTLGQTGACIDNSELVISHDTGVMHIAAARKKPLHVIWGNTIPEFGMSPYYGKYKVYHKYYQVDDLNCRPCSKIGYEKCPKGHFKCILEQNIEKIVLDTNDFLKQAQLSQSVKG